MYHLTKTILFMLGLSKKYIYFDQVDMLVNHLFTIVQVVSITSQE